MPSLSSLNSSLFTQIAEARGDIVLIALDPSTDAPKEILAFQYFPEAVSDTKAINYQQKEIPGASLPIYQWVSSGERLISFTAMFSADVDLMFFGQSLGVTQWRRIRSQGLARRNIDIRSAIVWLRRFTLPTYGEHATEAGVPITYPPAKLKLFIPGSGIGLWGGDAGGGGAVSPDTVLCVMTQCDIEVQAMFPSGMPRLVQVSLAFAQVPQEAGTVRFPAVTDAMSAAAFDVGSPFLGYQIRPTVYRALSDFDGTA